jgi:hypothetical protein
MTPTDEARFIAVAAVAGTADIRYFYIILRVIVMCGSQWCMAIYGTT